MEENLIKFTLVFEDISYPVETNDTEYESLLGVISDVLPVHNFGICYGGGCCGTCEVEIKDSDSVQSIKSLSCEVMIDTELSHTTISIP